MLGRGLVGLGCALIVTGCTAPPAHLDGWIAGCAQIEQGPTCVLEAAERRRPVTIFVAKATLPATVTVDEHPLTASITRSSPAGIELEIDPRQTGALIVHAANGRFAAQITDTESADPEAVRTSTQARADLRAGEWRAAVQGLDQASTSHAAHGAWSRAVSDGLTAAYALLYAGHQPHEARRRLERVQPWLRHHRDGWALYPYYRGLYAIRAADPSAAIAPLRQARKRLHARGQEQLVAGVDEVLAVVLEQLGRHADAERVLQRLRAASTGSACVRARRLNNVAYASLLAADATAQAPSPLTLSTLEQAAALYDLPECRAQAGRHTASLHRVMAAVLGERFEDAQVLLQSLPQAPDRLDTRLWRLELWARSELGLGHPQAARARLQDALTHLPAGALPDAEWRLNLWLARALRAEGHITKALGAYAKADALLDVGTLRIPFGQGRAPFTQARNQGAMEWAELLVARGQAGKAACVSRRARSRTVARAAMQVRLQALSPSTRTAWESHIGALQALRTESEQATLTAWGLAAKDFEAFEAAQAQRQATAADHLSKALAAIESEAPAWSCQRLPEPNEGEVTLVFVTGTQGPLGFAIAADRTEAHQFESKPAHHQWLAPFDDMLSSATRIRLIIEPGPTFTQPHTWPWRGRPLNAQRPVAFALDLGESQALRPVRTDLALVVADPERNLAGARSEAAVVTRALGDAGWQVERLEGSMASPSAVRHGLARASLLHFSGHGRNVPASPWGDRLGLHRGALSARDVLADGHVPESVILTGCRTASQSGLNEIERVGLAQAFLLSGAQQVLGATSDVADEVATEVGTSVHASPQRGPLDLAQSFHRVAARLDARGDGDWAAFRVWVP